MLYLICSPSILTHLLNKHKHASISTQNNKYSTNMYCNRKKLTSTHVYNGTNAYKQCVLR